MDAVHKSVAGDNASEDIDFFCEHNFIAIHSDGRRMNVKCKGCYADIIPLLVDIRHYWRWHWSDQYYSLRLAFFIADDCQASYDLRSHFVKLVSFL